LYTVILFFQAVDGIRFFHVTGVQTCALPIFPLAWRGTGRETPILIQHVSSDPTHVPPPVAMLSVADPGPPGTLRSARGLLVAGEIGRASGREKGEIVVGIGHVEDN